MRLILCPVKTSHRIEVAEAHSALKGVFTGDDLQVNADAIDSYSPNGLPAGNFRVENIEEMSFPDDFADVVLSSAVLHFARGDDQFLAMLRGTWRVLKPGGLLFCRLASSIGMEDQVRRLEGRRYALPDGSERYLVDAELLGKLTAELGGRLLDPLKTTVVQNQRCMTTWVVRKNA